MSKMPKSKESEEKRISRLDSLLRFAVKRFRDCSDPFNPSDLAAQNVTSDEVFDLSNSIASAIEYYLNHKREAVDEAMVRIVEEEMGPDMAKSVKAHLAFNRSLDKLNAKPDIGK